MNVPTADAVYLGSILTMDPALPRAQALALHGGRVLAVGSPAEAHAVSGPATETYHLGSACLLPGFHDAHVHLTRHGLELSQLDLSGTRSFDEALRSLRDRVAKAAPGEWLLASGFALNTWALPTIGRAEADALEAATGGRPTVMLSQDHHSTWVSREVLARAGLGAGAVAPAGGEIVFDEAGLPTGLLLETAKGLVSAAVPRPGRAELKRALLDAADHLASLGVTAVHHMAAEPADYFRELALAASDEAYAIRVWACIPQEEIENAAAIGLATGQGGRNFTLGGAKFFADGALGSRTAWMLEPYAGSTSRGIALADDAALAERMALAIEAGLAPVVHAIGDAANRAVVNAFENAATALRERGLRPRLEHAQHMHPADVARAGALGVVASMQPIHLTFDIAGIEALLPDRLARAYPMRSLARAGARLAFGSDTPVASPDVFTGLRAACRRASPSGARLTPPEALSPDEALLAYTAGAAYAAGWEGRSGMLRAGFDADLVVLSHDPLVSLDGLEVVATVKGGRFTFGEGRL